MTTARAPRFRSRNHWLHRLAAGGGGCGCGCGDGVGGLDDHGGRGAGDEEGSISPQRHVPLSAAEGHPRLRRPTLDTRLRALGKRPTRARHQEGGAGGGVEDGRGGAVSVSNSRGIDFFVEGDI